MNGYLKKSISRVLGLFYDPGRDRNVDRYIILQYHSLGESDIDDYLKLRIKPELFEEQIRYLAKSGYKVVALGKMVNAVDSKRGTQVCITFDDGFLDNLGLAVPILKKYGFPATVFVSLDHIYRKVVKKNYWEKWNYLTPEKLRELANSGIEIGSHACSHRVLTSLSTPEARREISYSKNRLEQLLGSEITLFSYPHGKFNKNIKDMVREEGYGLACASITGFNNDKSDLFELKRIEIRNSDSMADFNNKLMGNYNWLGYFQKIKLSFS